MSKSVISVMKMAFHIDKIVMSKKSLRYTAYIFGLLSIIFTPLGLACSELKILAVGYLFFAIAMLINLNAAYDYIVEKLNEK